MIDIVESIFEDFNYKKIESDKIKLYKSDTIEDYWVIFSGSPYQILEKNTQSKLMSLCKEACNDSALEKNANIICLWEINELNQESAQQLHQTEEDVYFFKKNVLYYSHDEYIDFKKQCNSTSISDILKQSSDDPAVFQYYKENFDSQTWQALAFRIFIKLTFMPVSHKSGAEISNLYANHHKLITNHSNSIRLSRLDSIIQDLPDNSVNIDTNTLLSTIIEQLDEISK